MTCNQPDLIIKIDWKILYWNMLYHNPYFNKQLGKQENDTQFQHSTRAALLYRVSKKVPDQLLNWGIENFWRFCMWFQKKLFLSLDTSTCLLISIDIILNCFKRRWSTFGYMAPAGGKLTSQQSKFIFKVLNDVKHRFGR